MDKAKILLEIVEEMKTIPPKDKSDIEELVENDEWGVALETICSVILEEKIIIHEQLYKKISDIGHEMEMDSDLWKGIVKLIKNNY